MPSGIAAAVARHITTPPKSQAYLLTDLPYATYSSSSRRVAATDSTCRRAKPGVATATFAALGRNLILLSNSRWYAFSVHQQQRPCAAFANWLLPLAGSCSFFRFPHSDSPKLPRRRTTRTIPGALTVQRLFCRRCRFLLPPFRALCWHRRPPPLEAPRPPHLLASCSRTCAWRRIDCLPSQYRLHMRGVCYQPCSVVEEPLSTHSPYPSTLQPDTKASSPWPRPPRSHPRPPKPQTAC